MYARAALAGILAVSMASAACGGAGVAGSSARSPSPEGVVAWIAVPAPLYEPPPERPVRYPTSAPPCRAGDLRMTHQRDGAAAGNVAETFTFTNVGSTPCLLRGYPRVSGVTATGRRRAIP